MGSQVVQWWRIHLPMQETWIPSLGQEDPLEQEMETHSSIFAWKIPGTEEPDGLQSLVWWPKAERAGKTKEGLGMQERKNQTFIFLPSPLL